MADPYIVKTGEPKPDAKVEIPDDYYKILGSQRSDSTLEIQNNYQKQLEKINKREEELNNIYGKYAREPQTLTIKDFKALGILKTDNLAAIKKAIENQLNNLEVDTFVIENAYKVIMTN